MPQECKLIIFDLDGVLLDAKEIHYLALNKALADVNSKYIITREEHISKYDGLPTKIKLAKLVDHKGFPESLIDDTNRRKQAITQNMLLEIELNLELVDMITKLKEDGFKVVVASNSVHQTVIMSLERLGILHLMDLSLGSDDVKFPKPNPAMYLQAMVNFGVSPNETLIVEDSEQGRSAVDLAGANLCPVNGIKDVTYELVSRYAGSVSPQTGKWKDDNLNVLIPMAGAGSRFEQAGYSFPKPLIEVNGKPMIQVVVENLAIDAHHIFLVRKEDYSKYSLKYLLNNISPGCDIVIVDHLTDGAASTTLLAERLIDNNKQLLIANSDQYLEWNSSNFMYTVASRPDLKGMIPLFEATHPKWSYAKVDQNGYVLEVAEKRPISNLATAGVYYWRTGASYVKAVNAMMDQDIRTNGEFYIAPAYNQIIKTYTYRTDVNSVGSYRFDKMWGLGTPEDLEVFLNGFKG